MPVLTVSSIIAICGLGGHAFGSFKERGGEHMWLRDALPYDITAESGQRIARIMVYGHVPSFLDSDSFQILEDTGIALHSDLRNLVSDGSFKPIVFIAHSLGGLVVKQFLISLSYSKDEVDQKLTRAVYGLSFFGVPHDGMVIHSLIPMAGDGPNRFLPESNRSINSKILSIQHREFLKALGGQGQSEIILFYETCLSPTALKDENGRWKMSGEPDVLGTKASATHCRHWENGPEHICAINRTHSEMVKFAEGDPEYDKVLERIKPLAQRAITARRGRLQRNLSKDEQNCLQSLAFEQMQDRGNDIDHAIQGTCEWLLKHDTYMNWPTSLEGLLCIKGKPGAGKSTLLKYAISKQRDIPSAKDDDVVLSFFFHGRGNALQKSPLGFLRSVLYQALEKAPEAFPALVDAYQQKCNVMGDPPQWQWNPEELWRFFESSLPKILANRSIWLFVDALDECGEGHARNLVQRFKALLKGIPQLPSGIHFRVCFSCRHYPILSSRDMLEVCLETENEDDITTYVRSTLELESFEEPMRLKIRDLIISRASGVFLWAQLVVKKVQDLELDGDGPNMIEATIHSMPKSLRELYKELIRDMTPSSLRLIQWVCFAARPLSTEELRWAMAIDVGRPSLQECQKAYDYIPDSKRMGQQVIKLSRGLAEVFTGSNTQVVQFIHPSVKDFFMDEGLVTLDNTSTSTDEAIGQAQFQLLRTCTLYLKMEEISQSTSRGPGLEAEFPFLHYAVTLWVSHLQKCDATNFSSRNILELLSWPSNAIFDLWTHLYKKFGYSVDSTPVAKTTLIHIAAEYCLAGLLTAILENNCQTCENFDLKDDDGRTPLSLAAESGNEAIIKTLLDTGQVNVNSKDRTGLTPLSWAAEYGQEAVVKLLLNAGAEINSKSLTNRTPLSWAAEYEQEAVLKLLLNAGAE
ncbi:nacht and ankyrin domain-containing protein [Trichoderma sp. TUCIM 5745]